MKEKKNLWTQKKKEIIFLIAAVMVLVFAVSFVNYFKVAEEQKKDEYEPYTDKHHDSRFFFRIYYPDNWDVLADSQGFLLSDDGLVVELFPLKELSSTPGAASGTTATPSGSSESTASATIDPRAGMERDNALTMKIYYKKYGDIVEKILQKDGSVSTATPTAQATATAKPIATTSAGVATPMPTPPVALVDLAEYIFEDYKKEHEGLNYEYMAPKTFKGESVEFCSLPYTFVKDDIKMQGEVYIASRAFAYYIITVEGTNASFEANRKVISNMLYNFRFEVLPY